jgi:hypothetical protein
VLREINRERVKRRQELDAINVLRNPDGGPHSGVENGALTTR